MLYRYIFFSGTIVSVNSYFAAQHLKYVFCIPIPIEVNRKSWSFKIASLFEAKEMRRTARGCFRTTSLSCHQNQFGNLCFCSTSPGWNHVVIGAVPNKNLGSPVLSLQTDGQESVTSRHRTQLVWFGSWYLEHLCRLCMRAKVGHLLGDLLQWHSSSDRFWVWRQSPEWLLLLLQVLL